MSPSTRRQAATTGLVTLPQVNLIPAEIAERRRLRVVQTELGGAFALALVVLVALYLMAGALVAILAGPQLTQLYLHATLG